MIPVKRGVSVFKSFCFEGFLRNHQHGKVSGSALVTWSKCSVKPSGQTRQTVQRVVCLLCYCHAITHSGMWIVYKDK